MAEADDRNDSPITGISAAGMVRVTFRADGLIESVSFAPQMRRLTANDLADAVLEAVSAAQQELLRRAADREREAGEEAAKRLSSELEDINAEYLQQTARYQTMGIEILKRMEG